MHTKILLRSFVVSLLLWLVACSSDSNPDSAVTADVDSNSATHQGFQSAPVVLNDQEQFITTNAFRDNVVVTASGLQYEVLRTGTGPNAGPDSVVTVHYSGELIDGTEFDSSYVRGQPATFALSGVIPGWVEALQLMNAGSHYRVVIPAELAYGDRGVGTEIPPGAVLVFEIELLEINSA